MTNSRPRARRQDAPTRRSPANAVRTREQLLTFLERRSEPDLIGGCRLWSGAVSAKGYGQLEIVHLPFYQAHRASWWAHCGDIPAGLCVCHKCDIPRCINPAHLFLGTVTENNADRDRKGRYRHVHGVRHPLAKLSPDLVAFIRANHRPRDPEFGFKAMAQKLGVDPAVVASAYYGKTWRALEQVAEHRRVLDTLDAELRALTEPAKSEAA